MLSASRKGKLYQLTEAASYNKSAYALLICCFGEGGGTRSGLVLEVLLAYWQSWFVFPNGPEDGLNSYGFPLAFFLAKARKVALASIYPGTL